MHEELALQTILGSLIEEDVFDYGLMLELMV
jgi:hypothetical protein